MFPLLSTTGQCRVAKMVLEAEDLSLNLDGCDLSK
jgi:hypothetical protein